MGGSSSGGSTGGGGGGGGGNNKSSTPVRGRNNKQKAVRAKAAPKAPSINYGGNGNQRANLPSEVNRPAPTPTPPKTINQDQGDGRAAAQAADAALLNEAEAQRVATAKNAATLNEIESQRVAEQKAENKRVAEAAQKAASKAKNKQNIVDARDRRELVPVGSAWSKPPPGERNRDPLERLDRSSGRGMQNQGDAFYPTGFAEGLEDNMPTGFGRGLLASPMASVASTVGKTAYNQTQYGMNKDAADLYKELIADPANEGKTVKELVQMARKPQMDKQKANAFINDGISNTANESQLNAMRPFIKDSNMSDTQWNSLPIEMKRQLTRDVNPNSLTVGSANQGDGGGGLLAGGTDPVEEEESTYSDLDSYLKLFNNNTF